MNYMQRHDYTEVISLNKKVQYKNSVLYVIDDLCQKQLFTYYGRIKSIKKHLGFKSLVPIYISKEECLFPTASARISDCMWINYRELKVYYRKKENCCLIFQDGQKITVTKNASFIARQIKKAKTICKYLENQLR